MDSHVYDHDFDARVKSKLLDRGWEHIHVAETPEEAVELLIQIWDRQIRRIKNSIDSFKSDDPDVILPGRYPGIAIGIARDRIPPGVQEPHGFVQRGRGIYTTTITRPQQFRDYLLEQLSLLHRNYGVPFIIGLSEYRIPVEFVDPAEGLTKDQVDMIGPRDISMIASSMKEPDGFYPLALFSGPYTHEMFHRLSYYTGTDSEHFQQTVFAVNYSMYPDSFMMHALELVAKFPDEYELVVPEREKARLRLLKRKRSLHDEISAAIEKLSQDATDAASILGGLLTALQEIDHDLTTLLDNKTACQMPAYHLKAPGKRGVTLINIGVGPSNAATIVECMAPLRLLSLVMAGHCGGLRQYQSLGQYVAAEGYVRADWTYHPFVPLNAPLLPMAEIQEGLRKAIADEYGKDPHDLRDILQTGVVASTNFRTNEVDCNDAIREEILNSRALAVDMESAVIAAGCHRWSIPYGVLLVISDLPYHSILKSTRATNKFYKESVERHMRICFRYWQVIKDVPHTLPSRKLRGRTDPAFR
jgi:AMP nucleosidase